MKSILLATTVLAAMTSNVLAADVVQKQEEAPAPLPVASTYDWTGFYAGVQAGYGWQRERQSLYRNDGLFYNTTNVSPDGFVGGAHLGYNWQLDRLIFGTEFDIEGKSVKKTYAILAPFFNTTGKSESDIQGSARLRVGYSFDRLLPYLTAGATVAHFKDSFSTPPAFADSPSSTRFGWTVGAGLEYAFTNNWSGRLEYRYTDFGTHTNNLPVFLSPPGYSRDRVFEQSVRFGVSYRFN